jgi:hypothetical protein
MEQKYGWKVKNQFEKSWGWNWKRNDFPQFHPNFQLRNSAMIKVV